MPPCRSCRVRGGLSNRPTLRCKGVPIMTPPHAPCAWNHQLGHRSLLLNLGYAADRGGCRNLLSFTIRGIPATYCPPHLIKTPTLAANGTFTPPGTTATEEKHLTREADTQSVAQSAAGPPAREGTNRRTPHPAFPSSVAKHVPVATERPVAPASAAKTARLRAGIAHSPSVGTLPHVLGYVPRPKTPYLTGTAPLKAGVVRRRYRLITRNAPGHGFDCRRTAPVHQSGTPGNTPEIPHRVRLPTALLTASLKVPIVLEVASCRNASDATGRPPGASATAAPHQVERPRIPP